MTALLERLIDFLVTWIHVFSPFFVLGDDRVGLVRRLGRYHRDMRAGWNWKLPILETPMHESGALESSTLPVMTLTTRDGQTVALRPVLTWQVIEPRAYILGCDSGQSVVNDVCCGVLGDVVPEFDADEVLNADTFVKEFRRAVRERAKDWGVRIKSAGLADRVRLRAYRLITTERALP